MLDILDSSESDNMTSIGRVMQVLQYPDLDGPDISYKNCTILVVNIVLVHKIPRVLSISEVRVSCIPCFDVTEYIRLIISFARAGNTKRKGDHLTGSYWYSAQRVSNTQSARSIFPGELESRQFLSPSALPH